MANAVASALPLNQWAPWMFSQPSGVQNSEEDFPFPRVSTVQNLAFTFNRPRTDPLVGHGRHFGRTIRMFCRVQPLIKNGLARTMQLELGRLSKEELSWRYVALFLPPNQSVNWLQRAERAPYLRATIGPVCWTGGTLVHWVGAGSFLRF